MDDRLHRWKLGFNTPSFTMRTGLADHTTLRTFRLVCFLIGMLLSSLGFPAK